MVTILGDFLHIFSRSDFTLRLGSDGAPWTGPIQKMYLWYSVSNVGTMANVGSLRLFRLLACILYKMFHFDIFHLAQLIVGVNAMGSRP